MQKIIEWVLQNKEWLFSGIGVAFLVALFTILQRLFSGRQKEISAVHETIIISETKPESVGHRFEFSDGVIAYADLRGSWRIDDFFQFKSFFKDHNEFAKKTSSLIHSRAAHLLERYSYAEAKARRRDVEFELAADIAQEVKKFGIKLDRITISPFRRMVR